MNLKKKKSPVRMEPRTQATLAERRRVDNKNDSKRDTLEFSDVPLTIKEEPDTFNPYERNPAERAHLHVHEKPVKRDLRKLSEWIKTLRAVEEKKARGEE